MSDDPKTQLLPLLALTLVLGGAYAALKLFGADEAPPEAAIAAGEGAGPADATETRGVGAEAMEARAANAQEARIETEHFIATFTNLNTAVRSMRIKGERFASESGELHEMVSTDQERYYPLRLDLGGIDIPEDAVWTMSQPEPNKVRFELVADGFTVTRQWEAGSSPYQLWSTVRIQNDGRVSRPVRVNVRTAHYVSREAEGSTFLGRPSPFASFGQCSYDENSEQERFDRNKLDDDNPSSMSFGFGPDVGWAAISNQYFATLIAAEDDSAERCQIFMDNRGRPTAVGTLFEAALRYPRVTLAAGADTVVRTPIYMGPKDLDLMHAFGHRASAAVDLGWFTFIAEGLVWLLRSIFALVGNWGLAIILLTFLVKLVLYPLTAASFKNMAKMNELKPHMEALNEKYGDDREAKGQATMNLYREHKVNPFAGCLPMLLQMPIWFALYQSLSTNLELYHAPFALFWTDLSARDPYFVLPLLLGGLMFVQQKLTPTASMDPTQAKIMLYMMPIMITGFMLFLPAGLCLYMVTNSVLSIAQQHYIRVQLAASTAKKAAEKPA
ncbi:MAG: membrane protein insertase YidC [Polyangiales bacterium]|nr:membrane protein insertase YidC [Myxococcales bacterium]MCB9657272.1 membrane protein insertase YidC [Sandaracinaceae bacterium]